MNAMNYLNGLFSSNGVLRRVQFAIVRCLLLNRVVADTAIDYSAYFNNYTLVKAKLLSVCNLKLVVRGLAL